MKIIRIFPRRTLATPDDPHAFVGSPGLFPPEADEYRISVTFTFDVDAGERLADEWSRFGTVRIGGPAYGDNGDFTPGEYLKNGYVITSRGCPNNCWFCFVPKREGKIRELPITDGWRIQDNNLLACSDDHINGVFDMLKRQPKPAVFQGGLESARMRPWIAKRLYEIKPRRIYFAYDRPRDYDPLVSAVKMCSDAGIKPSWHTMSAYVLIGFPNDTFDRAVERMNAVMSLGIYPFAMLYCGDDGKMNPAWRPFQREWANPIIVGSKMRDRRSGKP